ncbi:MULTISPECIES: hypothetical protein [unclassified Sphingopyxis]|uniref:hypothetical protein n=1 Tax=unclassified Sphingopyxis TaxID=2614943 RepID=UPI0030130EE7
MATRQKRYTIRSSDRRRMRRSAASEESWVVVDDLPQRLSLGAAEMDIFEAMFGDILDDLLRGDV